MLFITWTSNWLIAPFTFIFWTLVVCLSLCCCCGDLKNMEEETAGDSNGPAFFAIPWICGLIGALIFFVFFVINYGSWTLLFGLNMHFSMSWPHIFLGGTLNIFTVLIFLMFPNDVLSSMLAGLSMVDKGFSAVG